MTKRFFIKIFLYESKRLIINKFFLLILLVLLFYGGLVLRGVTVFGVSHTAPFSPWSFGDYLSRMLPLLVLAETVFLTFFTSGETRRAAPVIDAVQTRPALYGAARCAAVIAAVCLAALACALPAAVFYAVYFDRYDLSELLPVAALTLPPPLMFTLGVGRFIGKFRPRLVYALAAVPFVLAALPLPGAWGILNGGFFTEYPLMSGTLDPAFSAPVSVVLVQCAVFACGAALVKFKIKN